jgi:hypothetical protein
VPFAIAIEPGLIRVTFSGALTAEDLRGIAAAADEIEAGASPVPPRIVDMRAVTDLKVAYPDVLALAERRRARSFPNEFRSAIVVQGSSQLGIARMFQTLNDNPQIAVQIFTDPADAMAWLRG